MLEGILRCIICSGRAGSYVVILVEPAVIYLQRVEEHRRQVETVLQSPSRYADPWDEVILAFLEANLGEPILFMHVVNAAAACCQAQGKSERSLVKIEIIRRLTRLIQAGLVHRLHGKYVRMANGQIRSAISPPHTG